MHVTGHPDSGPVRPGLGMTDMSTGLYCHGAIMAALFARERSGRGQHISASLFETQISLLINIGANWLNMGVEGQRFGAAHPSIVPYNTWRCKDGMYLALAANNQNQYQTLCKRIGMPELVDDARFTTNALRVENRKAMDEVLDEVFGAKTINEWLHILDGSVSVCWSWRVSGRTDIVRNWHTVRSTRSRRQWIILRLKLETWCRRYNGRPWSLVI